MDDIRIDMGDCIFVIPQQEPPTDCMIQEVYKNIAEVILELNGIETISYT